MASVFLSLFVIACIGVAVNRHLELNNCSLEVRKLAGIAEECGKTQLTSLETVKKAEFVMQEMQEMKDYKNQAAANAEKARDSCEKHLRNVEGKLHQLIHNITVVVAENEKCKISLKNCFHEFEVMKTKTAPSPAPTDA